MSQDIIGRAEQISLPEYNITGIPAKVDTGADLSSIWASHIAETDQGLSFILFDSESPLYTGQTIVIPVGEYEVTRVANSFGQQELRYKIKMSVRVKDRLLKGTFTLANRSNKTYPVLLGRRLLAGKFLVDVKKGKPLHVEERAKKTKLMEDMKKLRGES